MSNVFRVARLGLQMLGVGKHPACRKVHVAIRLCLMLPVVCGQIPEGSRALETLTPVELWQRAASEVSIDADPQAVETLRVLRVALEETAAAGLVDLMEGYVRLELGAAEAEAAWRAFAQARAARGTPEHQALALWGQALAAEALGRTPQAMDHYLRGLQEAPHSAHAPRWLARFLELGLAQHARIGSDTPQGWVAQVTSGLELPQAHACAAAAHLAQNGFPEAAAQVLLRWGSCTPALAAPLVDRLLATGDVTDARALLLAMRPLQAPAWQAAWWGRFLLLVEHTHAPARREAFAAVRALLENGPDRAHGVVTVLQHALPLPDNGGVAATYTRRGSARDGRLWPAGPAQVEVTEPVGGGLVTQRLSWQQPAAPRDIELVGAAIPTGPGRLETLQALVLLWPRLGPASRADLQRQRWLEGLKAPELAGILDTLEALGRVEPARLGDAVWLPVLEQALRQPSDTLRLQARTVCTLQLVATQQRSAATTQALFEASGDVTFLHQFFALATSDMLEAECPALERLHAAAREHGLLAP